MLRNDEKKQNKAFMASVLSKTGIILIVLVIVNFLGIFPDNFILYRAGSEGEFIDCQSNCKNIGTALEEYNSDNNGRYPQTLQQLVPVYLREIPECPMVERDTYSPSYQVSINCDAFTFCCQGENHKYLKAHCYCLGIKYATTLQYRGIPPNYPEYSSWTGLDPMPSP